MYSKPIITPRAYTSELIELATFYLSSFLFAWLCVFELSKFSFSLTSISISIVVLSVTFLFIDTLNTLGTSKRSLFTRNIYPDMSTIMLYFTFLGTFVGYASVPIASLFLSWMLLLVHYFIVQQD